MLKTNLKITLGSDDFKKIISESNIFIDKTLFLKAIIESGEEAILITRPRRWGKSLNMSMLEKFFSIEVDSQGNRKPKEECENRKLFKGGEIYFGGSKGKKVLKGLNIAKIDNGKYLADQGQFPVIFISFKDVIGDSYQVVESKIRTKISNLFKTHKYLKFSNTIDDSDKNLIQKYIEKKSDRAELESSLLTLSSLLKQHFNQKTYILVDEYDKPINYFLEASLTENKKERDKVRELITSIISSCGKSNKNLEKIILTGILDSLKKESGSGFNNVIVHSIDNDTDFSKYYGFSEEEVKLALRQIGEGLENKGLESKLSEIKEWYNGYNVPIIKDGAETEIQVYNPWSVMNHLSKLTTNSSQSPKSYWVKSGVFSLLEYLSKLKLEKGLLDKLKKLSAGLKISFNLSDNFYLLQNLDSEAIKEKLLAYLLLHNGYINKINGSYVIPNNEVLGYFRENVVPVWAEKLLADIGIDKSDFNNIFEELNESFEKDNFIKKFNQLLIEKTASGKRSESDFQSLIVAITTIYETVKPSESKYKVLSKSSVTRGRMDSIFYPVNNFKGPVIIHEYKKLDNIKDGEPDKKSEEALWQILEKNYLSDPLARKKVDSDKHNWDRIKIRGIVFIKDEVHDKWSIVSKEADLYLKAAENLKEFFLSDLLSKDNLAKIKEAGIDSLIKDSESNSLIIKYLSKKS